MVPMVSTLDLEFVMGSLTGNSTPTLPPPEFPCIDANQGEFWLIKAVAGYCKAARSLQ